MDIWGNLAKLLPDFEKRTEQTTMADAISETLLTRERLICEAGTGIGKSFAYLLPAIRFIKDLNKQSTEQHRLVVSTYTKTLQQQLFEKDIPLLQSAGLDFKASLALGSANYLCLRRRDKLMLDAQVSFIDNRSREAERLVQWSRITKTGIRSEFEKEGVTDLFSETSRDPDLCIGKKCSYYEKCFYKKSREELRKSDVILVNHWLFFADIGSGRNILPEYSVLVFDEAHQLEDVATLFAGIDLSNYGIDYFLRAIRREIGKTPELNEALSIVASGAVEFFDKILKIVKEENKTLRITEKIGSTFPSDFNLIRDTLKEIKKRTENIEKVEEIERYIIKCNNVRSTLVSFLEQKHADTVYWVETTGYRDARKPRVALRSAPISVSEWMQKNVFSYPVPIILTSATLTVNKNFDFVANRIGLEKRKELLLSSSFDYKNNVAVYIPQKGPAPDHTKYPEFVAQKVEELAKTTLQLGGTLVLFTSFKLMNYVHKIVKDKISVPCFKQDEFAKNELIRRFKEKPSVLFGVSSFWQGIDIPGKPLSTVIITRLPFEVPDSPITESRAEKITEQGGIPFTEYQLPQAVMQLKQGFGRLIRRKEDFGIVAVLDMRIVNKNYGRTFFASLPTHTKVRDIQQVEKFFSAKMKNK